MLHMKNWLHKTTIKINIIYCTMEVSNDKYSMNDRTLQSKQHTANRLRSEVRGQQHMEGQGSTWGFDNIWDLTHESKTVQ